MPRYRRIPLTREKSLQTALTSVVVGAAAAAVTYVITRLMLQRDPMLPGLPADDHSLPDGLEPDSSVDRTVGAGPTSPPSGAASGADTGAR